MTVDARLRISLSAGEFEVEGSAEFVQGYDDLVRQILEKLPDSALRTVELVKQTAGDAQAHPEDVSGKASGDDVLPEFGEAIHRLPRDASGTDQILVAAFYASKRSPESLFATVDASKLLVDQGIKLSNPSQSLKNNLVGKKVFKSGKHFKLSREGIDKVRSLLGLT